MCLQFMFLLTTRLAAWLRLARREETWKTAGILILRQVELLIAPAAACGAVDGADDQAGAFVVAQGVRADTGAAGGLGYSQARCGIGASGPGARGCLTSSML